MTLRHRMFDLIERHAKSTQTITAFCAEHDISYAKFNYWRRQKEVSASGEAAAGFVRLTPPPAVTTEPLSLHLPDGSRLQGTAAQLATFYRQISGGKHA